MLEATQRATGLKPNEARSLLGRFLFGGEAAEKPLDGLSGGERRRLSLAILVHSGANVLVLDEPTNHLDLESREALEAALQAFPGSLLLISHDRALLDAVGTRTVAVEDGTLHSYVGGWPEYLRVREERKEAERTAKRSKPPAPEEGATPAGPSKNRQRRAGELEKAIEAAEAELQALEAELADPAAWNDPRSAAKSTRRHDRGQAGAPGALRGVGGRAARRRAARRPLAARLRVMPSSTLATVSQASTADSSVSKMSFQRITIIGSMPFANSDATRRAHDPVGLVLEPVDLHQVAPRGPRPRAARAGSPRRARRCRPARRSICWACSIGASTP